MGTVRRLGATVIVVVLLFFGAASASAQPYVGVPPGGVGGGLGPPGGSQAEVLGFQVTANPSQRPASGQVEVLSLQVGRSPAAQQAPVTRLAFTGADLLSLALIAVAFVLVGVAFTRVRRPRRSTPRGGTT
jgi:hypothetical protein